MQVTLYEFVKRENSTKRPTASTPSEITGCVLKEATSIIRPTLVFTGIGNPTRFNYLYIEELGGRYYFIEDWVSVRNRWECSCTVDVLASFKTEIGDSTEYILRSSAEKDTYVVDTMYPATANCSVTENTELSIFEPGPNGVESGSYIVGIITNTENAYGAVGYYVFTASAFRGLVDALYSDNIIEDVANADLFKAQCNPIQYIVSVKWFPEGVGVLTDSETITSIKLGWWRVTTSCKKLAYPTTFAYKQINIPKHPQASIGQYLNTNPYTRYSLTFMPFGEVLVDPSSMLSETVITLWADVDLITGISILYIYAGDGDNSPFKRIQTLKGQVGVDIKLAQVASDYVGVASSVISGVVGAVTGFVTGNVGGAVAGISNSIGNAIDNTVPSVNSVGGSGGLVDLYAKIIFKAQFWKIVQTDNDRLGSPLCKIRKISNIPGYIKVNDADFRASCTAQENVMIKDYMEGGFFYE